MPNKREVAAYMRREIGDHIDITGEANTTAMAEDAADEFSLYGPTVDCEIPEWVYDLAVDVAEAMGAGLRL